MHTHNVKTNLSGEVEYSYDPAPDLAPLPRVEPETFMGFRRKDGRAAIRNEIWIIPVVGCVNENAKKMVQDNQDLVTGSIEGLYTFPHPFGCSQTGHDHAQTRKLLAALVRHPNAAGVLVLHWAARTFSPTSSRRSWDPTTPTGSSSWSARTWRTSSPPPASCWRSWPITPVSLSVSPSRCPSWWWA